MDDGIRSLEDPLRYNEVLIATLHELGIRFVEMGESIRDINERVNFVKRCLVGRYVQYEAESDAPDTPVEKYRRVQRVSSCRKTKY